MSPRIQFGPQLSPSGVTFRLWAPAANRVDLMLDRLHPMKKDSDGWHRLDIQGLGAGALYKFRIDGELEVPDPVSHFQPQDVSGPSEIVDHDAYRWQTSSWRGRAWEESAVVEIHVGTFTREGNYRSAAEKLDHVVDTGLTAIELMPLANFAGRYNWGYDGVLLYAPDTSYGRPEELKALIDAAHARGLMVFLDVVYNHFGPEGNYLGHYAPSFFTSAQTPWGNAVDYRVLQVRRFAIENALHWLHYYRFDGLRLDAIHAIVEPGRTVLLHELSHAVGELATESGRRIHLVLENDDNDAGLLDPALDPPSGRYRAQWNDDYHHAWHVLLTNEHQEYYQDYSNPIRHLVRTLGSGFAYQGEPSPHRGGRRRGQTSAHQSPLAFVNFLQNHDQIGNRPLGDRLSVNADEQALTAALAIMLLAPMPPLLFMGEEWGSTKPFPFFCDFRGELAEAVRAGRRREFAQAYERYGNEIPDPLAEETVRSAVLDWDARQQPKHQKRLAFVRKLLRIRKAEIVPRLAGAEFGACESARNVITASWRLGDGSLLTLVANLSEQTVERVASPQQRQLWSTGANDKLAPWSVLWSIGAR
jgi:malto-oligosyltrehalose trehalohydrolase